MYCNYRNITGISDNIIANDITSTTFDNIIISASDITNIKNSSSNLQSQINNIQLIPGLSIIGPTGPQGNSIIGPTGPQGNSIIGPTGPQGISINGPTGPQGISIIGPTGPQGNSIIGPTGPQGNSIIGNTGPQGNSIIGPTGPQGDYARFQIDTVSCDGNPSGVWLNIHNPLLYGFGINLEKGNPGNPGNTGDLGPTGPKGSDGSSFIGDILSGVISGAGIALGLVEYASLSAWITAVSVEVTALSASITSLDIRATALEGITYFMATYPGLHAMTRFYSELSINSGVQGIPINDVIILDQNGGITSNSLNSNTITSTNLTSTNLTSTNLNSTNLISTNLNFSNSLGGSSLNIGRNSEVLASNSINIGGTLDAIYLNGVLYNPFFPTNLFAQI